MDRSCESTPIRGAIGASLTLVSSFDFCAECLASFITVNLGRTSEDPELPLGFTVSDVIVLKGVVSNSLVLQFGSSPILARRYFLRTHARRNHVNLFARRVRDFTRTARSESTMEVR